MLWMQYCWVWFVLLHPTKSTQRELDFQKPSKCSERSEYLIHFLLMSMFQSPDMYQYEIIDFDILCWSWQHPLSYRLDRPSFQKGYLPPCFHYGKCQVLNTFSVVVFTLGHGISTYSGIARELHTGGTGMATGNSHGGSRLHMVSCSLGWYSSCSLEIKLKFRWQLGNNWKWILNCWFLSLCNGDIKVAERSTWG